MTGAPTLSVKLDDGTGTYPFDITTYVELQFVLTITRGRGTEFDQVQPGTCTLTLNNTDGRFTIGSAVYPVFYDQKIRVSETVGGTTYIRFTGYVQDWPVTWPDGGDTYATTVITATDRQTRLSRRKLRSITEQEIMLDNPYAYYTFGEAQGSTSAGDKSGKGRPALQIAGATGLPPVFGNNGPNTWDGITSLTETLNGDMLVGGPVLVTTGTSITVRVAVLVAAGTAILMQISDDPLSLLPGHPGLSISTSGAGSVLILADASGARCAVSGLSAGWHDVMATIVGTTYQLYVDGVASSPGVGTGVPAGTTFYRTAHQGGASLAHFATFDSALSAARAGVHANSILNGFNTERADQRITRLASYANVPVGEQNLETGQQASVAAQSTSGVDAQTAMQAVADAEGGTVFTAGDGKLTEQNKSHRPLKATSSPGITLTVDQIDPTVGVGGARNYLINTATGSRDGGASQRSVSAASAALYDEYPADRSNALLPTDELMLNQLTWLTAMYSSPLPRLPALPLDLLTLPQATVQSVLASEFGDLVRITGWPAQTPASLGDLLVEGWTETLTHNTWDISLNTVPAQLFRPWILGDATYSQLGVTTRPYF